MLCACMMHAPLHLSHAEHWSGCAAQWLMRWPSSCRRRHPRRRRSNVSSYSRLRRLAGELRCTLQKPVVLVQQISQNEGVRHTSCTHPPALDGWKWYFQSSLWKVVEFERCLSPLQVVVGGADSWLLQQQLRADFTWALCIGMCAGDAAVAQ